MQADISYLNELVSRNKEAFSDYPGLKWLNPYDAVYFQQKRNELLNEIPERLFKDTKPFFQKISPGCNLCGQGFWSCLFITGKCNASCFYCPTKQTNDGLPVSQGLTFDTPESYAEYVKHFGFKAVSFSGGEPLLVFERTLDYLLAVRKYCGSDVYIWMYTNGILGTKEKFKLLAEAGLNEVRFDIGATNYNPSAIEFANEFFDNITVEIPAVPEKKELLIQLLPVLEALGVKYLNLHQLRLTKYNVKQLIKHNYTYIPAERPLVLESELAALEILLAAKALNLGLGGNYCSFFFKNRFQKSGFRKRINATIQPGAILTEQGFIRKATENSFSYENIELLDSNTVRADFKTKELRLDHKTYQLMSTRAGVFPESYKLSMQRLLDVIKSEPAMPPKDKYLFDLWQMEFTETGLRDY